MQVKSRRIKFSSIIKWIIFATNIVAIILLFCGYLSWRVSPLKTNLFQFIGLSFGAIFFINVCYLIFWTITSKWKLAFVSFIALVLCYKPILTFFPMNFFPKDIPENSIKILTYNVQGFIGERRKDAARRPILEYVARTNADLVLVQEYYVSKTGQTVISHQDVKNILSEYPYYSITELGGSNNNYAIGLALFSKFPIENTHGFTFDSSFNGAAVSTVNINGKRITVANVHLESNRITADDKQLYSDFLQTDSIRFAAISKNIRNRMGIAFRARAQQVSVLKDFINTQDTDGVIIAGDFNDTPISYTYGQMRKGLNDAFTATGFGPGITYHEDFFLFRIDYILHSKNFKAYRAKVNKVFYSDHHPLETYLSLGE
jgi:endonuclease/exonuclease/phosphatase family metal-dependent hydrolase